MYRTLLCNYALFSENFCRITKYLQIDVDRRLDDWKYILQYNITNDVVGDKYDQKLIFSDSKLLLTLGTIAKLK